jgi:hypothetical protein
MWGEWAPVGATNVGRFRMKNIETRRFMGFEWEYTYHGKIQN